MLFPGKQPPAYPDFAYYAFMAAPVNATRDGCVSIARAIGSVDWAMSKLSHTWIFGMAFLGVVAVGIPDYLIGFEISLSIFYLGPVGIAAWYAGRKTGALIALISTFAAIAADIGAGHHIIRLGITS